MKITLKLCLSIIISFNSLAIFSQFAIDSNLVIHYPFNGNALDQSNNGYNATVHNAMISEDRFGNVNSAYSFSGDGYLVPPDDARFKSLTSYSISFWVKTNQTTRFDLINQRIGNTSPSNYNFGITFNSPGLELLYSFPHYNNQNTSVQIENLQTNEDYNDGNWHHFVFIKDTEKNSQSMYMDNQLVETITISDIDFLVNGTLLIGRRYDSQYYFSGSFDDLRIYNIAIDSIGINTLYNESLTITEKANPNMRLFPNPAHDILHIHTNQIISKAEIINMLGVVIDVHERPGTSLNIDYLPRGLYVLNIFYQNEEFCTTKKFLKK